MATLTVVGALLKAPNAAHYGLELMGKTGLESGTVYPILARLERLGWIVSRQEQLSAANTGRPLRRYYQVAQDRLPEARAALDEAVAQLLAERDHTLRSRN